MELFSEIIKVSNAEKWADAKNEWVMEKSYLREGSECLCGKYPITKVCVLVNVLNGWQVEVGRCCAKKFKMKLDNDYDVLQRVKKDLSKSVGARIIDLSKKKCIITEWEYKFYSDTMKKRKMTEKQENIRKQINKKIVERFCK